MVPSSVPDFTSSFYLSLSFILTLPLQTINKTTSLSVNSIPAGLPDPSTIVHFRLYQSTAKEEAEKRKHSKIA